MPIPVICPGCKAQFRVSDKFAGKQGPCPKCKALINVPAVDEVKIHVDEPAAAAPGKPASPDATPRPIRRKKMQIGGLQATLIAGGAIAVLFVAWIAGDFFVTKPAAATGLAKANLLFAGLGLLVVSIPLCAGLYELLRDDELEPFAGANLWIRAAICGAVYTALWGGFAFTPDSLFVTNYIWLWLPIPFVLIGALTGFASFDLSFENGALHYAFYLLIAIVLRALVGLPALWNLGPPPMTPV